MSTRRSKKIKNLEQEVELIFSQDESNEERNTNENANDILLKTPSQTSRVTDAATPKVLQTFQELLQTPRRSCRKSIKPSQDYDDIVNKSLKSCTRSAKSHLLVVEEKENEELAVAEVLPKWTPAKVGRVSQKRGRKSRRTVKAKSQEGTESKVLEEQPKYEENDEQTAVEYDIVTTESLDDVYIEQEKSNVENNNSHLNIPSEHTVKDRSEQVGKDMAQTELNKVEIENQEKQLNELQTKMEQFNVEAEHYCGESEKNIKNDKAETENRKDSPVKDLNETIILVQEDPEDCSEKTVTSNEEICTVHDSSNTQVKNGVVGFGNYLKSKEIINLSDLGLNPIKDDEEEVDITRIDSEIKTSSQDAEDMPSLIICDDDDEGANPCIKLNDTFEAKDSIEKFVKLSERQQEPTEEFMETLILSDDGETPKKIFRNLKDTELKPLSNLSTPKASHIKVKLPSTPQALLSTPKTSSIRKQTKKDSRFPTPYRIQKNFKFNNVVNENVTQTNSYNYFSNTLSLTTMEPKEIVLCGIRKRSLSLCINTQEQSRTKYLDGPLAKVKPDRVVSFYSPANQTTLIDDLDLKIAKSVKKQKPEEKIPPRKFVTTRRKRSLSLDESISTSLLSKLPRPVITQGIAKKSQNLTSAFKSQKRTKLPNFAAIHQKQFREMENLVEHVNRKQERSKNLINSATKLKPVSAQKSVTLNKNSNTKLIEKPKAVKKINSEINKSLFNATNIHTVNKSQQWIESNKTVINLPDPRLCENKTAKQVPSSRKTSQQQKINKYLKPSQATNIEKPLLNTKTVAPLKPAFNLSTSLMAKPSTSSTIFAENANISHMGNDKMNSRLQRHMDLFKGRVPSTRSDVASRKNDVILKGVRSNRRFELQMQHRKNLEQ